MYLSLDEYSIDSLYWGNWTPSEIDLLENPGVYIFEFTPADSSCALAVTHEIEILESRQPVFNNIPEFICFENLPYELPLTSENGIEGSWNLESLDSQLPVNTMISLSFTPDNTQCTGLYIDSIIIVGEHDLSFTISSPSNCSVSDGTISINGTTTSFEYSLDATSWQSDPVFENLSEGFHSVFIRSAAYPDCIEEEVLFLEAPNIPILDSIQVQQITNCSTDNGSIVIFATGDMLEYSIDGGMNWQSSSAFSDLPSGMYNIMIRPQEFDDCIIEELIQIEEFTPIVIQDLTVTELSDCNTDDAAIQVIAQGENLLYSINNTVATSNNIFENLSAGIYLITVFEEGTIDCEIEEEVIINPLELPDIELINITEPSNCNPQGGSIQISSNAPNVQYSLDQTIWQDSGIFNDLEDGIYTLYVSSVLHPNCSEMIEVELSSTSEILDIENIEFTALIDCNSSDGSIIIESPVQNLEYSIDGGMTFSTNSTFMNLGAGIYDIYIRLIDNPDCYYTQTFEIRSDTCPCGELTVDYEIEDIYCEEANTGRIQIIDIQGYETSIIEISWSNGVNGDEVDNLDAGTYFVDITFDNDCSFSDTIVIERFDPLSFVLNGIPAACEEATDGIIEVVQVSGGSGNYSYSISGEAYQEESIFYNLSADEYLISVLDDNGCIESEWFLLEHEEPLEFNLPTIEYVEQGESVYLNALLNPALIDSFLWSPSSGILNPGELVALVSPEHTTEYLLTVYYDDCVVNRSVTIEVLEDENIYLPTILSTSSIGTNNRFFPQMKDSDKVIDAMYIYDRWGNLVFLNENFQVNDSEAGWDGHINDSPAIQGVYVYMLKISSNNNKDEYLTGTVTLIK